MKYTIALVLLAAAPAFAQHEFAQHEFAKYESAQVERSLPAFFIPNVGQTDSSVRYMVDTPELRAGFTAGAAIFQLGRLKLQVRFAGANAQSTIEGQERLNAHANFMTGSRPRDWKTNLPVYHRIRYRDLYPGIDMSYGGAGRQIKSEFVVAPGADANRIRLDYSGAKLSIAPNGDLLIRGDNAEAREEAPVAYQEAASGGRVEIPGRYLLLDADSIGFEIAAYDHSRPLIIDPILSYATYLGGSGMSAVTGLAVDSSGDLYATGWTESLSFQVAGAPQTSNAGGVDAFVVKLNPAGNALLYATYLGGSGDDRGLGIAVDSSGEACVTGSTASTNFPLVSALKAALGGGRDAFALKLNAAGNTLVYSTYLGGTNTDMGNAIAVDSLNNAYIAGDTLSANFPVLGAAQSTFGGNQAAFVTKLSSAGAMLFSTFLGGSGVDHAGGIALDSSRAVYVAGGTTSTNFPVVGAIQTANGGSQDAFLTKLNSAGSAIIYSTYLGGTGGGIGFPEQANAVAVDGSGNAYVAGTTNSANFPVTAGAFQTSLNAIQDAFVAKVNAAGNALVYCSYLGGSAFNWANGVAVAGNGGVYVSGYTSSFDFPTAAPVQASFNGLYDAFVSVFNAAGNSLSFSTYFGGSGSDEANAIAVDAGGNMYLGGQTSSVDLALSGPIQSNHAGGSTGWVARLAAPALQFFPMAPCRLVDTRGAAAGFIGVSPFNGPSIPASGTMTIPVLSPSQTSTTAPAPCGAIPSTAQAYSMNVTVVPHSGGVVNYVSLWAAGSQQPFVSTLNDPEGLIVANAAIVPAGMPSGGVSVYNAGPAAVDIVIDMNGYFAAPASLQFYPVSPCRLVDTRGIPAGFNGIDPFAGPSIPAEGTMTIPVQSAAEAATNTTPAPCGVIPSTAQAYSFNLTVVPVGGGPVDYVSLWPAGSARPFVATLNDPEGLIAAGAAIVPTGTPSGGVSVFNSGPAATDVVIDMNGYFAPPAASLLFYPVLCRLVDTRGLAAGFNGIDPFAGPSIPAGGTMTIPVQSAAEAVANTAPAPCGVIPSTAQAYSINLTVVPHAGGAVNYVSVWPAGSHQPFVSTLDDPQGLIVSNAAIVPAGASSGGISVYNAGPSAADVVIDMNGYLAP
jgi:hypothetical protein